MCTYARSRAYVRVVSACEIWGGKWNFKCGRGCATTTTTTRLDGNTFLILSTWNENQHQNTLGCVAHSIHNCVLEEQRENKTIILIHLMRNLKAMWNPKTQRDAVTSIWCCALLRREPRMNWQTQSEKNTRRRRGGGRSEKEMRIKQFLPKRNPLDFSADYLLSFTSCCHWVCCWWFGDYVRNSIFSDAKRNEHARLLIVAKVSDIEEAAQSAHDRRSPLVYIRDSHLYFPAINRCFGATLIYFGALFASFQITCIKDYCYYLRG